MENSKQGRRIGDLPYVEYGLLFQKTGNLLRISVFINNRGTIWTKHGQGGYVQYG